MSYRHPETELEDRQASVAPNRAFERSAKQHYCLVPIALRGPVPALFES